MLARLGLGLGLGLRLGLGLGLGFGPGLAHWRMNSLNISSCDAKPSGPREAAVPTLP